MKKTHVSIFGAVVAISLLALALSSCAQPTNAPAATEDFSAPSMGTPAELVATGCAAPATSDGAISLYNTVCAVVRDAIMEEWEVPSSVGTRADIGIPISVKPQTRDYNKEIRIGTGKAILTGSITPAQISNDLDEEDETTNTTYADYESESVKGEVSITLDAITLTFEGTTYTVSGKIKVKLDQTIKTDYITGSDADSSADDEYSTDFDYKRTIGVALSVKTSTGVGAKFILSKSVVYSKNDVDAKPGKGTNYYLYKALEGDNATLSVYNDDGTKVLDAAIPYVEVPDFIYTDDLLLGLKG